MAELDFSGTFLNYDSSKDGQIYTILDEAKLEYNDKLQKNMV